MQNMGWPEYIPSNTQLALRHELVSPQTVPTSIHKISSCQTRSNHFLLLFCFSDLRLNAYVCVNIFRAFVLRKIHGARPSNVLMAVAAVVVVVVCLLLIVLARCCGSQRDGPAPTYVLSC